MVLGLIPAYSLCSKRRFTGVKMTCSSCTRPDGKPLAPFDGASPNGPRDSWPDTFVEEMEGWGRYFCPTCRAGLEAAKNRQASHRKLERKATTLAEKKGRDVLSPQAVNQTNAPPALSVASPVDLVSSASPSVAPSQPQGCLPWLIAIGAYIAVNVWVWQENQSVGR